MGDAELVEVLAVPPCPRYQQSLPPTQELRVRQTLTPCKI